MDQCNYTYYTSSLPFLSRNTRKTIQKKKKSKVFHHDEIPRAVESRGENTCIVFIAHKGVWHDVFWTEWNTRGISFFVHKDKDGFEYNSQSDFGILVPNPIAVERGRLSHLKAIIHSLKFAFEYGHFERFVVLSGDSLPVKSIHDFLRLPTEHSVLAYEIDDEEFVNHNMEMSLCRRDVDIITTQLYKEVFETDVYLEEDLDIQSFYDGEDIQVKMMDEYVIGTFLYGYGIRDFTNNAFAGWIAIDNPSQTFRSITLSSLDQIITCDKEEHIAIPDSSNGYEHHVLMKFGMRWRHVMKSSIPDGDKITKNDDFIKHLSDFNENSVNKVYDIDYSELEDMSFDSAVLSQGHYFLPLPVRVFTKVVANQLIFNALPFDEFLVFRKISPQFVSFVDKLKSSVIRQTFVLPFM